MSAVVFCEAIADPHAAANDGYQHFSVRRLSGALGAEISDIDLSRPLDDAVIAELRQALLDHLVIFFRDQELAPATLRDIGRRFGDLHVHEFMPGLPDCAEVMPVVKTGDDKLNFGGTWHSDVTYHETPPLGSILYGMEIPEVGGDTMFANMYLGYETLSDGLKSLLEGRRAVHSAAPIYGAQGFYNSDDYQKNGAAPVQRNDLAIGEVEHPIFRTHPETGRKSVYVNQAFTVRISGMNERESAGLLAHIYSHVITPEFTCRFRWAPGSVAFWDNRCVQHYALNDYPGMTRRMHRVTVMGDRPV